MSSTTSISDLPISQQGDGNIHLETKEQNIIVDSTIK